MPEGFTVRSRIRDYDVRFVDQFGLELERELQADSFSLVDQTVMDLYREQLEPRLRGKPCLVVEADETRKTLEYCQVVLRELVKSHVRKTSTLVAIGGGVIQDVTAFCASILFRGIDWVFFPTTLLAQADSCIGSKSSINLGEYKNQLGTFFPPARVFIDVSFLRTLPVGEIKSGIGEILHYYLFADGLKARRLSDDYDQVIRNPGLLEEHIRASLAIKKRVIEVDEFDRGERNLFNYGHTFGHAIESITNYRVSHGQAVTLGMDIANYISLRLGYLDKESFRAMHEILSKNAPPFRIGEDLLGGYFEALSRDKKNTGKELTCILSAGPGALKKVRIHPDDGLKGMIRDYFHIENLHANRPLQTKG